MQYGMAKEEVQTPSPEEEGMSITWSNYTSANTGDSMIQLSYAFCHSNNYSGYFFSGSHIITAYAGIFWMLARISGYLAADSRTLPY